MKDYPEHQESPGHRALRRGRWSEAGRSYLVTAGARRRQPLFRDFASAAAACRSFRGGPAGGRLLAWVLMPDHAHWIIELGNEPLERMVWRLKSDSARSVRRVCGGHGAVWQRGYHDRAFRRQDDLKKAARYVVFNPVRAGIVDRVGDYPFWDAIWID